MPRMSDVLRHSQIRQAFVSALFFRDDTLRVGSRRGPAGGPLSDTTPKHRSIADTQVEYWRGRLEVVGDFTPEIEQLLADRKDAFEDLVAAIHGGHSDSAKIAAQERFNELNDKLRDWCGSSIS